MPRGRPPIPESERKEEFNAKLDPKAKIKLKIVCAHRTVTRKVKKYSEAAFIEEAIEQTKIRRPTAKQIAAYNKEFPDRPYTPPPGE